MPSPPPPDATSGAEALLNLASSSRTLPRLPSLQAAAPEPLHAPYRSPPPLSLPHAPLHPSHDLPPLPLRSLRTSLPPLPEWSPAQPTAPTLPAGPPPPPPPPPPRYDLPAADTLPGPPRPRNWTPPRYLSPTWPPPPSHAAPHYTYPTAPPPPPPPPPPHPHAHAHPHAYYYYPAPRSDRPTLPPYSAAPPPPLHTPVPAPLALPLGLPCASGPLHSHVPLPALDASDAFASPYAPPQPAPRAEPMRHAHPPPPPHPVVERRPSRGAGLADLMNPTDKLPDAPDVLPVAPVAPSVSSSALVAHQPLQHVVPVLPVVTVAPQVSKAPPTGSVIEKRSGGETLGADIAVAHTPRAKEEGKAELLMTDGGRRPDEDVQKVDAKELSAEPGGDAEDSMSDGDRRGGEPAAEGDEITRCPCGSTENSGTMICCDECNTWQHTKCMGFRRNEDPANYFCHLCRPHEMRPNCIANPKYKERNAFKDRDRREPKRDVEVVLAPVKPVELRRIFGGDLRQKRAGVRVAKGDVFGKYAGLMRSQFGKYRQSVIDGLIILLEMSRADVVEKLDAALTRARVGSGDKSIEEKDEKKRTGADSSQDALVSDANSSRSQGSGRHTQKRARPNSLSGDALDLGPPARGEAAGLDSIVDTEAHGLDSSTGRALSREERKLQQTIKLIERLEGLREKKKPRTGDAASSPKSGHPARPKTPRASGHVRAVSPKVSATHSDARTEERKEPPILDKAKEPNQQVDTPSAEQKQQQPQQPPQEQQQHPSQQPQPGSQTLQPQSVVAAQAQIVQPRIVSPNGTGSDSEPPREKETLKKERDREKEPRNRDRSDRVALRRRDGGSPEGNNGGPSGRRRGILERERSQENKRRRGGAMTREAERRAVPSILEGKRDASLDFKLFVPGPSLLGSRRIDLRRISRLDREEVEQDKAKKTSILHAGPRSNKKEWLLQMASTCTKSAVGTKPSSPPPTKKRYRQLETGVAATKVETKEVKKEDEHTPSSVGKKTPMLSVSMVVVSEKGNLPDKGQILESSRLVLPNTKEEKVLPSMEKKRISNGKVCLKKRARMFASTSRDEATAGGVVEDVAKATGPASIKLPKSPKVPSPAPHSPRPPPSPRSPASPTLVRSPMLRSSPVPRSALRSALLRPVRKGSPVLGPPASRSPSPRLPKEVPRMPKSRSPSPDHKNSIEKNAGSGRSGVAVQGLPAATANGSSVEKPNSGPRSAPVTVPANAKKSVQQLPSGEAAIKSAPAAQVSRSGTQPGVVLGMRSLRSAPAPELRRAESPRSTDNHRLAKIAIPAGVKAPSLHASPRPRNPTPAETTITISDIFQQRLEGFLKPPSLSPVEESIVNTAQPSPRSSTASPPAGRSGSVGIGGAGGSGNSLSSIPLHGLRSIPAEGYGNRRGGSFGAPKRSHGSFDGLRSSPGGDSVPSPPGSATLASGGEKPHFRNGRNDPPPGRHDHNRGRPSWNNYGQKNGWMSGSGRGPHSSKDGNARPNRRGR